MNFTGTGQILTAQDVESVSVLLGVDPAVILSIIDVETTRRGFDTQGRVSMLFEPVVFWRLLGPGPAREKAIDHGVAAAPGTRIKYPTDSYPRLALAMTVDETAALRSASWGLGQVMGFNHSAVGFSSVEAMIRDARKGEREQLFQMAGFIRFSGLVERLSGRDLTTPEGWIDFARTYNGPGYARNQYHVKLAAAYGKHASASAASSAKPAPVTEKAPLEAASSSRSGGTGLFGWAALLAFFGVFLAGLYRSGGVRRLWEKIVRFRTWLVNVVLAFLMIAPDVLNTPEILALFPVGSHRWIIAACFLVNIWLRPRPAVMRKDLEGGSA